VIRSVTVQVQMFRPTEVNISWLCIHMCHVQMQAKVYVIICDYNEVNTVVCALVVRYVLLQTECMYIANKLV
jgi:hypothetical protein